MEQGQVRRRPVYDPGETNVPFLVDPENACVQGKVCRLCRFPFLPGETLKAVFRDEEETFASRTFTFELNRRVTLRRHDFHYINLHLCTTHCWQHFGDGAEVVCHSGCWDIDPHLAADLFWSERLAAVFRDMSAQQSPTQDVVPCSIQPYTRDSGILPRAGSGRRWRFFQRNLAIKLARQVHTSRPIPSQIWEHVAGYLVHESAAISTMMLVRSLQNEAEGRVLVKTSQDVYAEYVWIDGRRYIANLENLPASSDGPLELILHGKRSDDLEYMYLKTDGLGVRDIQFLTARDLDTPFDGEEDGAKWQRHQDLRWNPVYFFSRDVSNALPWLVRVV
ncbi:hypothetical protein GQ53DRAFT_860569 [Thozetella sp. PMI_491]|nr:hypothetical protein GQ53DRAFT_860569 [Thozetella sp. PMI_491]